MATTTNYSWTTPDDTDLVKDGAAAIRTLGTAIDSTVFTNAGAAINKTIVDAKGDIIAATAADTVSRLAVGANDTILTADSSTATGLKWSAPASSIPANSSARVDTRESTTSTSYTDLSTSGPAVTVTTGTAALVILTASVEHDDTDGSSFMDYAVSGATTRSASDTTCLRFRFYSFQKANRASAASRVTLTAGSNTFTAKYKQSAGVGGGNIGYWSNREIFVINLA